MRKRFAQYAWLVLVFNLLVIVWGALVRASKSGDGCGNHWPLCNGQVLPAAPRVATIIEFAHRATSGLALVSIAVLAYWAFRTFSKGHPARRAAAASSIFIVTEALLGAGLVLFRYVADNASNARAVYLSLHLVNTLLLLAAISLTAWWASGRRAAAWVTDPLIAKLITVALGGSLVLGVSGAVTALGDTLFPVTSLRAGWDADLSPTSHILVRLRIWHPVIAVMVCGWIVIAAAWIARRSPLSRRLALTLSGLVGVQLLAGLINLWLLAPVWMQLVHLLLADLLWITLVLFGASALEQPQAAAASPVTPAGNDKTAMMNLS